MNFVLFLILNALLLIRPEELVPDLAGARLYLITIVACVPSFCAASATPWAWLPALAQITPRASCSGVRWAILLYAPRSLKEKTGCLSSRLRRMWLPVRREIAGASSRGLSIATSYTFAVRIFSRYLSGFTLEE